METQAEDILSADRAAEWKRDPYPLFAERRRQGGVFRGPVVDYSRLPESMRPKQVFSALSFDAVNTVFRDGRVFNSGGYDASIGLFTGRTILAMAGKEHREHRNLVSAAFKTKSLARWEPEIVRPVCNALIDEFAETGETDLVRKFTFEFPPNVMTSGDYETVVREVNKYLLPVSEYRTALQPARIEIRPGISQDEVINALGPAQQTVVFGKKTILNYPGISVELEDDRATDVKAH